MSSLMDLFGAPSREWVTRAACRGVGPDLFCAGDGNQPGGATNDSYTDARALCEVCPVRTECLDAGWREDHGLWSGTTPKQRRRARRARGEADELEAERTAAAS